MAVLVLVSFQDSGRKRRWIISLSMIHPTGKVHVCDKFQVKHGATRKSENDFTGFSLVVALKELGNILKEWFLVFGG